MAKQKPFDRVFFFSVVILVAAGFLIFTSASLGLLARQGAQFSDIALKQFAIGIVGGAIALFMVSAIPYRAWRKWAFYLFIAALLVSALVFIPGIGVEYNGAKRWILLGSFATFQPAELLKLAYVIYLATWLSSSRMAIKKPLHGIVPFSVITGIVAAMVLAQPDTGTFMVIAAAGGAMFLAAGARIRDILLIVLVAVIGVGVLAISRPYVAERIETFFNPSSDPLDSGYQLRQSLIAIGSGGIIGRGFGQSVQKFTNLPEPIGDSIFAVYAEEFGFVGGVALIGLFLFVILRGYRIAARAPDSFGSLLVTGIISLVAAQTFVNIGAMAGLLPLTGIPLTFVSHGGTALLFALVGVGIILSVSRQAKQ